ncbi:MAG: hypothetical protein AAF564_17805 [Bacteroidota bacterium]
MRYLENSDKVKRYLELRAIVDQATEEMDELKPVLMDALTHEPGEKFDMLGSEFTIRRTKVWEYAPDVKGELDAIAEGVKDLRQQTKDLQKMAQQTAKAQVIEFRPSLVVSKRKEVSQ